MNYPAQGYPIKCLLRVHYNEAASFFLHMKIDFCLTRENAPLTAQMYNSKNVISGCDECVRIPCIIINVPCAQVGIQGFYY